MQHRKIIIIFIFLISTFAFTASAQKLVNSPYSRFNLGTLETQGSYRGIAMGGVSTAIRDNSSIYFSNPASYSSLDTNSFVFDFGIDYGLNKLSNGDLKYSSDDMNFHHLILGFPVLKGWGAAMGFVPYSTGYYKMAESVLETSPEYDPLIGGYSTIHLGSGGFNKFFIGSGIKIGKNFSVGGNLTILLGQVTRLSQVTFTSDYYNVYHNNITEKLQLNGIGFDYGAQYSASLKDGYFLNAGVSLSSGNNYQTAYENLAYIYNAYGTRDTISNISDNTTKTFIPGTLRMGVSFGKTDKFTTGLDFVSTKWSKSKIPGLTGYAADTRSLLFGLEYIPDVYSNYSFLKRMEYRIGGHIGDNYLIINGEQIKEYGASLGVGIRMRRSMSKVNLFIDYTRKSGSGVNNFYIENYYTMGVSLNLYDFWFLKRKYE
jgi:hypothetical protein